MPTSPEQAARVTETGMNFYLPRSKRVGPSAIESIDRINSDLPECPQEKHALGQPFTARREKGDPTAVEARRHSSTNVDRLPPSTSQKKHKYSRCWVPGKPYGPVSKNLTGSVQVRYLRTE